MNTENITISEVNNDSIRELTAIEMEEVSGGFGVYIGHKGDGYYFGFFLGRKSGKG